MDYEVEFRSDTDDAWYGTRLVLAGEKLTIKYSNFPDDQDRVFEPGDFKSLDELEDFRKRFRTVSPQLQDKECQKVVKGLSVCAAYTSSRNDVRFYDAIVDEVVPQKHSSENGEEECRCTFILLWKHGPYAGCLSSSNIESMCLIQHSAQVDPAVSSFLAIAIEKVNRQIVSSSPLKRKSTFAERLKQGKKCAKRSPGEICPSEGFSLGFVSKETESDCYSKEKGKTAIRSSVCRTPKRPRNTEIIDSHCERIGQDTDIGGDDRCHVILINNLDKELTPSTIMEFIHKQTSVPVQACVLPSSSSETFTSAVIVSDCKENLEKLCEFLEGPNHAIVAARGRPWVVTREFSWQQYRMPREKLMLKSQNNISNRIGGIDDEIKVCYSGSGEYRTAKELKDLFIEFANHQQRLHNRLAAEEAKILQRSV